MEQRISVVDSLAPGARDVFAVCDLPGFASLADSVPTNDYRRTRVTSRKEWTGNKAYDVSVSQVRCGDLSGVPASDKLMSAIEDQIPVAQVFEQVADVVGGFCCVPDYLAGHPLDMRHLERTASERGPLTVFCSLELSAGIEIKTMRKRGAAVLAFVRVLSNARPVTLYVCNSVGGSGYSANIIMRIDTAPLDLARAAHVLTCPSVTRGLGYAALDMLAEKHLSKSWTGGWAYSNHEFYRRYARDNFMRATQCTGDSILIPGCHLTDICVNQPIDWLKTMLREHGGMVAED